MLYRNLARTINQRLVIKSEPLLSFSTSTETEKPDENEFKVLNLRTTKSRTNVRTFRKRMEIQPPRTEQMATDQDWGNVWPGPRSFHPATVPLPIRQGFVEKGAVPAKHGNAELMKIPNFLHLTPPVIQRQCEALKKFCTPWPKGLNTDVKCESRFPIEVISSSYCHSSPTIRDPLGRVVSIKIKVSSLKLNERARDKFMRLIEDRYDEKSDILTIVADRCPTKKQNYDYAMYLLTAVYHESLNIEEWEKLKVDADMEFYDWNNSDSKKNVEALFGKSSDEIENIEPYSRSLSDLMNEGENLYTLDKYSEGVRKLLGLSPKLE